MQQSEILKNLRIESDLTQKELAKKLGIGQSTIVGYEKGLHEATAEILSRYANFFNVSMDYLIGLTDEWTAEERAQGVIDHKKISVSADEETLVECYRTIGRKFGKKKQENFIKLAELYADEEG